MKIKTGALGLLLVLLCVGVVAVADDREPLECWSRYHVQHQHSSDKEREACLHICNVHHHHHNQPPEARLRECQSRCEKHRHGQERQLCQFRCEKSEPENTQRDPEQVLVDCRQRCQNEKKDDKKEMMKCERECFEEFSRQKPGGGKQSRGRYQQTQSSPCVFHEHHFISKLRAEHGCRLLRNPTGPSSKCLETELML